MKDIILLIFIFYYGNCYSLELKPVVVLQKDGLNFNCSMPFDGQVLEFESKNKGAFKVSGNIKVSTGPISLAMWCSVNGKYHFSRIPTLQNINADENEKEFSIPFDAGDQTVDSIALVLTTNGSGSCIIRNISVE